MLNGSAQGRVPEPKKRRTYSEIVEERDVLDRAISIGQQLGEEFKAKAQDELGAARKSEFDALQRQQALNLIAYERTAQALDTLAAGTNLEPVSLPPRAKRQRTLDAIMVGLDPKTRRQVELTKMRAKR